MGLTDSGWVINLIAGLAIAVGVVGVVVPVLPGLLLSWAGVLLWAALGEGSVAVRWLTFGVATAVVLLGTLIKYLVPGRRLKSAGVPNSALLAGGLLGVIGFFVIPVIGLPLGFVLGIYLVERTRLGPGQAWPSTKRAVAAAGMALLIEFTAALAVAVIWVFGLLWSGWQLP
ncbi:DUF456 domain-containing protein [Paractinoplanes hotanensis]|uniref:DUF456 domain-containing protein n=1 Tax=Paractinoplanes hotanensis TaxID=2906497 RepID=A0ABT0XZ69_9ACTN|nr:DUF456 domain-containing protein [Actinoplanes hotanensis]MCM4078905.1 DUF456 domain-containing protein [Actinoplanes hotanensis]